MKPLRIYLKNFMNHRLSEIDCTQFQSVLIVGKTKANDRVSNGVGKTTIFRAMEYALFNKSHATNLDKIVRDGKKKAVVEFDFELNGSKYRIYRHRTSTGTADVKLYSWENGEWRSQCARTPSATDEKIAEIIKISHKAFTYSVLFRQADLTGITVVDDPKKRKEILKEPLNLLQYTKLEEMAKEKARPIKKDFEKCENSISMLGNPDIDIFNTEKELQNCQVEIATNIASKAKSEKLVEDKKHTIEELKKTLASEDVTIHSKLAEYEKNINELNITIKNLCDKNSNFNTSLTKVKTDLKSSEDLKVTHESDLIKANETFSSLRKEDIVSKELDKVSKDELKGTELIATVKAEIKLINKSIPDGDTCPACHQSITNEYKEQIRSQVQEQLKEKNDDLKFYEEALTKCKAKKKQLETEQANIKKIEQSIKDLESKILSDNNIIHLKKDNINTLSTEIDEVEKSIASNREKLKSSMSQFEALKEAASKSNVSDINNKIFSLVEEIKIYKASIDSYNSMLSSLIGKEGALNERIKTRKADKDKIDVLKKQLVSFQQELKLHQLASFAFSQSGIPTFIIQTILDDLQFEANAALKELRPELSVQIDADLNMEFRRNGIIRDYSEFSHGQHVYIALAFKRAMARVIQKRLGIDIRIMALDEVDAPLDESGVNAFADAIMRWQKEFTIFVITHNKDLKDKFSSAILVEEDDDGAIANLVNTW
jgi:DNA repair exonuclease SbcCD ATPase subunit